MSRLISFSRVSSVVAVLVVLLVSAGPAKAAVVGEDLPYQLREELEAVLQAHVQDIANEKNDAGDRFQRASYSKAFRKGDDGTYVVALVKDIAKGDTLTTERYSVTLTKDGGKWKIREEKLEDSYQRLFRPMTEDIKFHAFDGFAFDREGMKVDVGSGEMAVIHVKGEPRELILGGPDLKYSYEPPSDLDLHQKQILSVIETDDKVKSDLEFDPQWVDIACDAATCREFLDGAFHGLRDSSAAELGPKTEKAYRRFVDRVQKDRGDNPFADFRILPRDEQRTYTLAINRDGKDEFLWLHYDNEGPWEVVYGASGYGGIFGYMSQATRAKGIQPYDVELRDDPNALDFQLTGLTGEVEVAVQDPEQLDADITYTMEIKRDLRELPFYLNNVKGFGGQDTGGGKASISINSLQDADGNDLTWVRTGASSGIVLFPDTIRAGTAMTLRMAFQNRGSIVKVTPSYSYMDRGGWLPFVRFTDKIEKFDLTVRAPARYETLGIGTKVSDETEGDVEVTRWVAHSPVTFPTIIFGDYVDAKPSTRAEKADGTEIPVAIHVDKNGMQDWEIRTKQLAPLAEQAVNALNVYRTLYGMDYPYGKLDLVNDPLGFLYGQAPASIIYLGSGAFRGKGTLASLKTANSAYITHFTDTLVFHETAHQWWGSLVGNANQRNYWFIESLAEFSAAMCLEIVTSEGYKTPELTQKGHEAYLDHVAQWRREILQQNLLASVQNASALWSGGGFSTYQALVYAKGPYAFHILRATFGDEKMMAFLKRLAQELGGKEIVTRDIQKVAEESFGGTMEWFFDQWIRGVGIPEYSFNYTTRRTEDGKYLVQGKIRQHVVMGLKKTELDGIYFRGVVPITVTGSDKKEYQVKLLVEGPETPFGFKLPVEPKAIEFNKDGEILAHDILVNRPW